MSRPSLSRALVIDGRPGGDLSLPSADMLSLPERAVQFGTGALLRGLVDAIIDEANAAGHFNGRVVAIGSTGSGRDRALNEQDGLFTLVTEGIEKGATVKRARVVSSVSRAISATDAWDEVLTCARNPLLTVVFSNTTEVGIALDQEDAARPDRVVPSSFPAKLTRFLHERARAFAHATDKGVVVVPCELIERNGDVLRGIVLTLARRWELGAEFIHWLEQSVRFCNTLVDRIVPGAPAADVAADIERWIGYRDEMVTVCEPYRLLVIEGDVAMRDRLDFARPEFGALVVEDATPYALRKVRLLNGSHTALSPVAILAGLATVRQAVTHPQVGEFTRRILMRELVPVLAVDGAADFALDVLDRFENPSIQHRVRDIMLHAGMKFRVRLVPSLMAYHRRTGKVPGGIAFALAAYLVFLVQDTDESRQDVVGGAIRSRWPSGRDERSLRDFARAICSDETLWLANLDAIPGFTDLVTHHLLRIQNGGALSALSAHLNDSPAALTAVA